MNISTNKSKSRGLGGRSISRHKVGIIPIWPVTWRDNFKSVAVYETKHKK